MNHIVPSFIIGMSAGAVLADGQGLRVAITAAVILGLLNAWCAFVGKDRT